MLPLLQAGTSKPVIDWDDWAFGQPAAVVPVASGWQAPTAPLPLTGAASPAADSWRADFVNYLGLSPAARDPNAKIVITLPPVSPSATNKVSLL
jgi:hypothetical protein